jgi:ferritin-like metal-binding protein YciE
MTQRQVILTWLKDAHAMEAGTVKALAQHAKAAENYPELQAGLHEHAEQTRRHAEKLEVCLGRLGARPATAKETVGLVMGTVQGAASWPVRDVVIKNALADHASKHFEIASYTSLIAAADQLGEQETAQVCREILAEEEEMAAWLGGQINALTQQFLTRQSDQPDKGTRASMSGKTQRAARTVGEQVRRLVNDDTRTGLAIASVLVAGVGAGFLLTRCSTAVQTISNPQTTFKFQEAYEKSTQGWCDAGSHAR